MFDDDTTGGTHRHRGADTDDHMSTAPRSSAVHHHAGRMHPLPPGAGVEDDSDWRVGPADGTASFDAPRSTRGTSRLDGNDPGPADADDRPLGAALRHGWRRKCPNCGSGPMLRGYLTVRDHCPVCDEGLHHARADDGPAYLTILIVGHLMAPAFLWAFTTYRPEPMVLFTVFAVGCIALSLYLLPRLKGIIVAWQWSRRMHGF